MRLLTRLFALFSLALAASAQTPTFFTLIPAESTTLGVSLTAGETYRVGNAASNCWSASTTVAAAVTVTPFSFGVSNNFPFGDPCPNVVKEFDVLETTAAQAVSVVNSGTAAVTIAGVTIAAKTTGKITIPALPPPASTTKTYTTTCTVPATITLTTMAGSTTQTIAVTGTISCPAVVQQ